MADTADTERIEVEPDAICANCGRTFEQHTCVDGFEPVDEEDEEDDAAPIAGDTD